MEERVKIAHGSPRWLLVHSQVLELVEAEFVSTAGSLHVRVLYMRRFPSDPAVFFCAAFTQKWVEGGTVSLELGLTACSL